MIFILISRVREIIGLIRLSKIHADYKTALLLIIATLVLSLIFSMLPNDKAVISGDVRLFQKKAFKPQFKDFPSILKIF